MLLTIYCINLCLFQISIFVGIQTSYVKVVDDGLCFSQYATCYFSSLYQVIVIRWICFFLIGSGITRDGLVLLGERYGKYFNFLLFFVYCAYLRYHHFPSFILESGIKLKCLGLQGIGDGVDKYVIIPWVR